MNLSSLTAREVLRICTPETDLERRLFDICKDYERDCNDNSAKIKRAIDLIGIGKVNDSVNILRRI